MKLYQGILLAVLLAVVPLLSACGPSAADRARQEAYRQAIVAYQKQVNEYNKQKEEEIGRAAWRERGEIWGVGGALKKKCTQYKANASLSSRLVAYASMQTTIHYPLPLRLV